MLLIHIQSRSNPNVVTHVGVELSALEQNEAISRARRWAVEQYPTAQPFNITVLPVGLATVLHDPNMTPQNRDGGHPANFQA